MLGLGIHPKDALLEPTAGADITVNLCYAAGKYGFIEHSLQRGNDSVLGVFHTPRLCNVRQSHLGLSNLRVQLPPASYFS